MYKPRIKKLSLEGVGREFYTLYGDWRCTGRGYTGHGWTPTQAYNEWLGKRRRGRSNGLYLARSRREAIEKRIKDREQRRLKSKLGAAAYERIAKAQAEAIFGPAEYNRPQPLQPAGKCWWWPF